MMMEISSSSIMFRWLTCTYISLQMFSHQPIVDVQILTLWILFWHKMSIMWYKQHKIFCVEGSCVLVFREMLAGFAGNVYVSCAFLHSLQKQMVSLFTTGSSTAYVQRRCYNTAWKSLGGALNQELKLCWLVSIQLISVYDNLCKVQEVDKIKMWHYEKVINFE